MHMSYLSFYYISYFFHWYFSCLPDNVIVIQVLCLKFPFSCLFAEFTSGLVIRSIKDRKQTVMGWKKKTKTEGREIQQVSVDYQKILSNSKSR